MGVKIYVKNSHCSITSTSDEEELKPRGNSKFIMI